MTKKKREARNLAKDMRLPCKKDNAQICASTERHSIMKTLSISDAIRNIDIDDVTEKLAYSTGYICDAITEAADNAVPIYATTTKTNRPPI